MTVATDRSNASGLRASSPNSWPQHGRRAMPPKIWVHPIADTSIDKEFFKPQDPQDPRAQHQGPCGAEHTTASLEDLPRTGKTIFNANRYSRWADCNTCGLRLGFWPRQGHTGKFTKQVHPKVVEEAMRRVMEMGRWDTCTKKLVDGLIQTIEGEIKTTGASAPTTPRQRTRQETRATSSPPSCQSAAAAAAGRATARQTNKAGRAPTSPVPPAEEDENKEEDYVIVTCQICGAEGHAALECPLIRIPQPNGSDPGSAAT